VLLDSDAEAAALAVRDHGIGLRPGEAAMVFNRFWRADPARARTSGGTGLGLSIALEDAHLHGGWLQAWGQPGDGAQFRLTLPRHAGDRITRSPLPLVPADAVAPASAPVGPLANRPHQQSSGHAGQQPGQQPGQAAAPLAADDESARSR
jgi:two-component system sensor histidine kinase MtrB